MVAQPRPWASQFSDEIIGPGRGGAGSALHPAVLISAGVATLIATAVAVLGIVLQLKVVCYPHSVASDADELFRTTESQFCNGTHSESFQFRLS
jgi:hypothetical protein